jgi:hypothetical protein
MENTQEMTPEQIVQTLFTKDPASPNTYTLFKECDEIELFEILITILLEALNIKIDLRNTDLNTLNIDYVNGLKPWFHSMGLNFNINKYSIRDTDMYNQYYCNIYINNELNEILFKLKKINKNYHFILNGNFDDKTQLNEYYAILKNNTYVYAISFDYL